MVIVLLALLALALATTIAGLRFSPRKSNRRDNFHVYRTKPRITKYSNDTSLKSFAKFACYTFLCILCAFAITYVVVVGILQPNTSLNLLRDPIWQFIGVILSAISLIISIIALPKSNKKTQQVDKQRTLYPNRYDEYQ